MTVVDANEPRPRNAERILKYRKAKTPSEFKAAGADDAALAALDAKGLVIKEWNAAGTIPEEEMNRIGKAGSPTNVKQIMSVVLTAGDYKNIEPSNEGVTALIHELIEDHTLG